MPCTQSLIWQARDAENPFVARLLPRFPGPFFGPLGLVPWPGSLGPLGSRRPPPFWQALCEYLRKLNEQLHVTLSREFGGQDVTSCLSSD